MDIATSVDGTSIAYDRLGEGPPLVLVGGGFSERANPMFAELATLLAPHFTVYNYDRRGRGDSGDTAPYRVQREIEDLAAVASAAGGPVYVFGGSSGAVLALEAATQGLKVQKLVLFEPPYVVAGSRRPLPSAQRLEELVTAGRRADAVELFMTEGADVPPETLAGMRQAPFWSSLEALAHTLVYEAAIMSGGELHADRLAAITAPTLILAGESTAEWLQAAARAVAEALPDARYQVLPGQDHGASPASLAPALHDFLAG
jgi:pimeloyl-ACP methyl ester carboxylesterase